MERDRRTVVPLREVATTGIFNLEVCGLDKHIPAGLNVRVRAPSLEAARARAKKLLLGWGEGITILRAGDDDLTEGESVRLFLDGNLIADDCPVDFEED